MQKFSESIVPAITQVPAPAPLAKELATFTLGAFKVGRTLEEVVDDTFTQIEPDGRPGHGQRAEARSRHAQDRA
jgi:hypothetical protein